ncbi:MAG: RNA polymerase sigma factor [Nocardioides sp.]|uniref:RNA polymerase sigma factor n=1 Tax=Nocardioides sp. TaxID=35761 RepID=UPI003F1109FA
MNAAGQASTGLVDRAATDFAAYRDGEEAALGRLVQELTPLLWNTARGCGLDRVAAEDAVQEAWVALYRNSGAITSPQAVLQWLVTTTRRRALTMAVRGRRTSPATERQEEALANEPDPLPGPEADAVAADESDVLWRHFSQLSERCRYLLRVVSLGERPDYAAISEALGMPVGSIGPTRGRCLAALRSALEADTHWSGTSSSWG